MEKMNIFVKELKKVDFPDFNEENFSTKSDEERYQKFIDQVVLRNIENPDVVKRQIVEKKLYGERAFSGIFEKNSNGICIIPERETLFDEIIGIHEITHLINYMSRGKVDDTVAAEVIPYFNEYDYLSRIDEFYAKCYEDYRLFTTIRAAKQIDSNNRNRLLPHIYAYLLLQSRKNDYNIKKLNKLNYNKKPLAKTLKSKGYTLNF